MLVSFIGILSACGNNMVNDREDKTERENMAYKLSRARYDGDEEKIYEYTPNVFPSDEFKNRYIKRINCKGKAYRNLIGIQNVEYQIVNAGEKKKIFKELSSKYGIDEEIRNDLAKVGYITYDIVSSDNKGKKKVYKNSDIAFVYEEKWHIIAFDTK